MIENICEGLKAENNETYLYITVDQTPLPINYKKDVNNYLTSRLKEKKKIAVDISQIETAGSDIMNTIAMCGRYAENKNGIKILVTPRSKAEDVLEMMGFAKLYPIFYTKQNLMESL
jgi:anti-anti-sigma regulatory factor